MENNIFYFHIIKINMANDKKAWYDMHQTQSICDSCTIFQVKKSKMTSDTVKMYVLSSFLFCSLWQRCILSARCSSVFFSSISPSGLLPQSSKRMFSHLELKMGSYCKRPAGCACKHQLNQGWTLSRSSLYAEYVSCVGPPKHQGATLLPKMF